MLQISSPILSFILVNLLFMYSCSAFTYSASPDGSTQKHDFFHTFSGNLAGELVLAKKQNFATFKMNKRRGIGQ